MRIRVERHSDFTVTHHVLKHLGIHPGASLVAAECMTADMGSHLRYLLLVDRVELGDDALEVVLPMQGDQGHPVLVQVQESAQAVDFGLDLRSEPLGDDFAEALGDLIGHRDKPDALLGLRLLDHVAHLARPLQLPLDPDALRVEVDVGNRQAAELGYPQPGLEQDEDALVVTRIMLVALDELKEPALLFRVNASRVTESFTTTVASSKSKGFFRTQSFSSAIRKAGRRTPRIEWILL